MRFLKEILNYLYMKMCLQIKGYHIPGKKNRMFISKNRLITDPKYKKIIKRIEDDLESQLLSCMRICEGETTTMEQQQSWIASSLFADDCWNELPEEHYYSRKVDSVEEAGAIIEIEDI